MAYPNKEEKKRDRPPSPGDTYIEKGTPTGDIEKEGWVELEPDLERKIERGKVENDIDWENKPSIINFMDEVDVCDKYGLKMREKRWADEFIQNWGNAKEAAMKTYPKGMAMQTYLNRGHRNKNDKRIRAYLSDKWDKAGRYIESVIDNEEADQSVRLKAAIFTYEQAHGKANQRVEVSSDSDDVVNVNFVNMSLKELDEYRKQILGD